MEKWQQAYKDYKAGMKYKEIAEKYGVSVNAVKSWAMRKWKATDTKKVAEKIKKVATTEEKKLQPKKGAGAPKGNQNAVGNNGGAPEGNKNAYKHGIYEKLLYSALSEEEKEWFNLTCIDEREEIIKEIRLCDIQLMKFMRLSSDVLNKPKELLVSGVNQTKYTDKEGNIKGSTTFTNTVAKQDYILKYDNEINNIRKHKLKCIDMLIKLNSLNNDDENGTASIVKIYMPSNKREVK